MRLDIIRHGEVIRSAQSRNEPETQAKDVVLEFEIDAGEGFWIAARAEGGDGTKAHTTPLYVVREGLRFWKYDAVDELIAKRLASLDEVESIVKQAREAVGRGGVKLPDGGDDRAVRQLALQGDALLQRADKARKAYDALKELARKEQQVRDQK